METTQPALSPANASRPTRRLRPPGPSMSRLRQLQWMRRDPLDMMNQVARDFGDVAQVHLVHDALVINHPDLAKHILQDNHLNYRKASWLYGRLEPLLGKGLLTSEGELWKRQRRLAQPAFHRARLAGFAERMARHTDAMLGRWAKLAPGSTIDIHQEMMKLTFAVVGDTLFSVNLLEEAEATGRALTEALEIIDHRMQRAFALPVRFPTPENLRLRRAVKLLSDMVDDIIRGRRRSGEQRDDLLGRFMLSRDEETGEGMSDQQLKDEVMTMVLAGHETTANALTWSWVLLSGHPAEERRLHEEVASVLGGRVPEASDLSRLPYTQQTVDEALRLYPPVWMFAREALGPDELGGYPIPAGTPILLSPYTLQRDARFWDNPEGFDPSRFAPEAQKGRPRFAYLPFAGGPRQCIGNTFALQEMQIVLAMVTQRYRLDLVSGQRVEPEPQITLRPKQGVHMTLRPRG